MKVSITRNGDGTHSVSRGESGLAFEVFEVPEVVANLWFSVQNRCEAMQTQLDEFLAFRKLPRTNAKHDCITCGCMLKPTGAVTDTNPAVVHFACESCGEAQEFFEDELQ
jgi:hypothetical protein